MIVLTFLLTLTQNVNAGFYVKETPSSGSWLDQGTVLFKTSSVPSTLACAQYCYLIDIDAGINYDGDICKCVKIENIRSNEMNFEPQKIKQVKKVPAPPKLSCHVNVERRVTCTAGAYPGITKEICETRGCCFNSNFIRSTWCFDPVNWNECQVNPESRVECGANLNKQQCEDMGCCFNVKTSGTKTCYRKRKEQE